MNTADSYELLREPVVSEKSSLQGQDGKFVLKVSLDSTKGQIKKAVEQVFGVSVLAVNTVKQKGKSKRFGRYSGSRSDYKKAYITVDPSSDFDILEAQVR